MSKGLKNKRKEKMRWCDFYKREEYFHRQPLTIGCRDLARSVLPNGKLV